MEILLKVIGWWFIGTANAFVIVGAFIAANDKDDQGRGMILYKTNQLIKKAFGTYWAKPFFGCYKCMSSVWGGIPLMLSLYWDADGSVMSYIYPPVYGAMYAFFLTYYATLLYNLKEKLSKPSTVNISITNDDKNSTS